MREAVRTTWLVVFGLGVTASAAAAAGTIQGKAVCRGVRDCAGAVVYIEKMPGRTFAPTPDAVMDQLNLRFVPHVLTVLAGTKVAFPNSDEVRHNVFSPSPPKRFNLGTYPRGTTKYVVFDKPGVIDLLCNVHAEMSAYIVVIETPHFAEVARNGTYVLNGVPAGSYAVVAWREELKPARRDVTIRDGESLTLDFELRR